MLLTTSSQRAGNFYSIFVEDLVLEVEERRSAWVTSFSFLEFCPFKYFCRTKIGKNEMVLGVWSKPDVEEFPSVDHQSSCE